MLLYGAVAAVGLVLARGGQRGWWLPLVAAAPLALAQLAYAARLQGRHLLPELLAGVALGSVVAAEMRAGGVPFGPALAAWAVHRRQGRGCRPLRTRAPSLRPRPGAQPQRARGVTRRSIAHGHGPRRRRLHAVAGHAGVRPSPGTCRIRPVPLPPAGAPSSGRNPGDGLRLLFRLDRRPPDTGSASDDARPHDGGHRPPLERRIAPWRHARGLRSRSVPGDLGGHARLCPRLHSLPRGRDRTTRPPRAHHGGGLPSHRPGSLVRDTASPSRADRRGSHVAQGPGRAGRSCDTGRPHRRPHAQRHGDGNAGRVSRS